MWHAQKTAHAKVLVGTRVACLEKATVILGVGAFTGENGAPNSLALGDQQPEQRLVLP